MFMAYTLIGAPLQQSLALAEKVEVNGRKAKDALRAPTIVFLTTNSQTASELFLE